MTVQVVIPWRPDGPERLHASHWCLRWWAETYPQYTVTVSSATADGPWCKAAAVHTARIFATTDVVIVADADVWCPVDDVVDAVQSGQVRWGMPHRTVRRLTQAATGRVLGGVWVPPVTPDPRAVAGHVLETYPGSPGGGIVVLAADTFGQVPLDPRFVGYGQEDHSWSLALHRLAGAPLRGVGNLWHLWHPPQPRIAPGIGSHEGLLLWHRYRQATTQTAMQALVAEAHAELLRLGYLPQR